MYFFLPNENDHLLQPKTFKKINFYTPYNTIITKDYNCFFENFNLIFVEKNKKIKNFYNIFELKKIYNNSFTNLNNFLKKNFINEVNLNNFYLFNDLTCLNNFFIKNFFLDIKDNEKVKIELEFDLNIIDDLLYSPNYINFNFFSNKFDYSFFETKEKELKTLILNQTKKFNI